MLEYQNKALATLNKQHTLKIAGLERELNIATKSVAQLEASLNTLAETFAKVKSYLFNQRIDQIEPLGSLFR